MNETLLAAGSALVILAIAVALVIYLYIVGSIVEHIAETLDEKIAAGAGEVSQHAAAIAPAAVGLRHRLHALARLGHAPNDTSPTAG